MPALAYCEPLPDFVRPDPETEKGFHCLRRMQMRSIGTEEVVAAVANGHGRWLPREKHWAFHHKGTTVITDGRRATPITCFRDQRADGDSEGAMMEPRFVGPCCAAVPPSATAAPAGLALVGRPFLVTKQQFAGSFTLRGLFRIVSVSDIVAITVRTSGISGGDWGDAIDGVSVELTNYRSFGDKRSVSIVQRGERGRTLRRVDFPSGFVIAESTRVRFELVHTPTSIACTFTAVGAGGDGAAVTIAADTEVWAPARKSHVALYNREKGRMSVVEHMELRLQDQPATDQLASAASEISPLLSLSRPAGATRWGNDTYTLAINPALCPTTQEMSCWHRQSEDAAAAKALVPARAAGAIRRELARQAKQLGKGNAGAGGGKLSWRARGGSGSAGRHDGHRGGSRDGRWGGWGSRSGS